MRYFVLKQDEEITGSPLPNGFHQSIDVRHVSAGKADMIPARSFIRLYPYEHTVFPDLLCKPLLLVTYEMKEVISAYEQYLIYQQILFLDLKYRLSQLYFMPMLEVIDCLSEKSEYTNTGRGAFSMVVLKRAPIRDNSLFQVMNKTQRIYIIRLDLAESLLGRNCKGFTITEAPLE